MSGVIKTLSAFEVFTVLAILARSSWSAHYHNHGLQQMKIWFSEEKCD